MKVTRRTAMAAAVAAMFAPTLRLRQEIDRERLLQAFCDDDRWKIRYDHSKPYQVGGSSYATDAMHMCWADLNKPEEDGGERRIPDVEAVRRRLFVPGRWQDFQLPPLGTLKMHVDRCGTCPECGDRRKSLGDQYPAEEWLNEYGYKLDWDVDDNTIRDTSCQLCHGISRDIPSIAIVCGVPLSYWRLRPIAALPNVRVSRTPEVELLSGQGKAELLCFEADGFQGVAMGLYPGVVKS